MKFNFENEKNWFFSFSTNDSKKNFNDLKKIFKKFLNFRKNGNEFWRCCCGQLRPRFDQVKNLTKNLTKILKFWQYLTIFTNFYEFSRYLRFLRFKLHREISPTRRIRSWSQIYHRFWRERRQPGSNRRPIGRQSRDGRQSWRRYFWSEYCWKFQTTRNRRGIRWNFFRGADGHRQYFCWRKRRKLHRSEFGRQYEFDDWRRSKSRKFDQKFKSSASRWLNWVFKA